MRLSLLLLAMFISLFAESLMASPWGIAGNASTKTIDGHLSVCLPDKVLRNVSLDSISVYENQGQKGSSLTMWRIELKKNEVPQVLKQSDCISYGVELPGYLESMPAKPLKIGATYYARINVDVADATRSSVVFYDVVFCVAKQHDGSIVYPQYRVDQAGREIKPEC